MKLTKEIWIERFRNAHGDKYDYSMFEYVNANTKAEIICRKHKSSFWQKPNNHKNGKGCPTCQSIFQQHGKSKISIFKEEGRKIHGNKYSYDFSEYKGALKKTKIKCRLHDYFYQTPQSHIVAKNGCPECAKKTRALTQILNAGLKFKEKAVEKHGDLYDYSETEYVGSHKKLKILCEEHGEFWQLATNHLSGKGCNLCKGGVAIPKSDWIKRAIEIHGTQYDYSKVKYNSVTELVVIGCREHGDFEQRAFLHLKSLVPCPNCRPSQPWTIERFLEAANMIHDYKFEYLNLPDDISYTTPIQARCPIHFEWEIPYAGGHASGNKPSGCPQCGQEIVASSRRITADMVEQEFIKHHGNKYTQIKFFKADKPILFKCPIHDEVRIKYNELRVGDGCYLCNEIVPTRLRKLETEKFVKECTAVHDSYYDYSNAVYRGRHSRIKIHCPEHKEFWQLASSHLKGGGCSSCAKYGFDGISPCKFYYAKIILDTNRFLWMIGITKNEFERRYSVSERQCMELIFVINFDTGYEALAYENEIKSKYEKFGYDGPSPLKIKRNTEIFTDDILRSYC